MFAPSASARRSLCLAVFVLVCLLPTLYVAYTAITIHSPSHAAQVAGRLRDWFDLDVEVVGVRYPRPGVVEYRELRLADPETGRQIAVLDRLGLEGDASNVRLTASSGRLYCEGADLGSTQLAPSLGPVSGSVAESPPASVAGAGAMGEVFGAILRRLERSSITAVTLECPELAVDVAGKVERLADVRVAYGSDTSGSRADVTFRLVELQMAVPSELEIRRDRLDGRPTTHFVLRTGPTPLPVDLVGPYFDMEGWLGGQARYQGTIWLDEAGGGWAGRAEGRLTKADLRASVSRHFPHRLSGTAELQFDQLRWADGRVQQVRGSLRAGPGSVSASLLEAFHEHLGFEIGRIVPARNEVPYRRLALTFAMQEGRLDVVGLCNTPDGDAVMVGDTVLLRAPNQSAEIAGLVRALVPPEGVAVPVNRESQALLDWLPMPGPREAPTSQHDTQPEAEMRQPPGRFPAPHVDEVPPRETGIGVTPPLRVAPPR